MSDTPAKAVADPPTVPPFTPEQARWIHATIAAELGRDTAYIMRVGSMARSVAVWVAALVATGIIGFGALNWIALQLWKPPEALHQEIISNANRHLTDAVREHDSKFDKLLLKVNDKSAEYSRELSTVAKTISGINDLHAQAEFKYRAFNEWMKHTEASAERARTEAERFLDIAKSSAGQIQDFAASVGAYAVVDKIVKTREAITDEVATRILAHPDFFELLRGNYLARNLKFRLSITPCAKDEFDLQDVSIEFSGATTEPDTIERKMCLAIEDPTP